MKNVKLFSSFLPIVLILGISSSNLIAQDLDSKSNSSRQQKKTDMQKMEEMEQANIKVLTKHIREKHTQLAIVIEVYLKAVRKLGDDARGDSTKEINFLLNRGLNSRIGVLRKTVFEDRVKLILNAQKLKSIIFNYDETDTKTLVNKRRIMEFPDIQVESIDQLQFLFTEGPKEQKFTLKDLNAASLIKRKVRLAKVYLTKLNYLLRQIEYSVQQASNQKIYQLDEVIDLGVIR